MDEPLTYPELRADLVHFSYLPLARKAKGGRHLLFLYRETQYRLHHWTALGLCRANSDKLLDLSWQLFKDRRIEFHKRKKYKQSNKLFDI